MIQIFAEESASMEDLQTGKDKIKQICDLLKHETLEPAKAEAHRIIELAQEDAQKILAEAKKQAEELVKIGKAEVEREKNVFLSSLNQAAKQSVDALKMEIEHKLFSEELQQVMDKASSDPQVVAKLINGLVEAIERDGVSADFSAIIPSKVSVNDLNQYLLDGVKKKLQNEISLGEISGGIKLQLKDKKMTIDASSKAVTELLEKYLRKDYRKWLFGGVGE
jgi:V/A-type H+-transporting ATPase subunit E